MKMIKSRLGITVAHFFEQYQDDFFKGVWVNFF